MFGFNYGVAGSVASAPFVASAVSFTAGGGLERGTKLTGATDSNKGILCFWFKFVKGKNGVQLPLTGGITGNRFQVSRDADNKWHILGRDSNGTTLLNINTTSTYTDGGGWNLLQASWDLSVSSTTYLYVNGSSDQTVTKAIGGNIAYSTGITDFFIGELSGSGATYSESLSEFYFATGSSLDFSNSANRNLFASGGHPIALTGAPTPIIYLHDPASTYGVNSGTGGNFSVTTTFTNVTAP